MKDTVGFIGSGTMAGALIKGIIKSGVFPPQAIYASDIRASQLKKVQKEYGIKICKDNTGIVSRVTTVVLAIKPQNMDDVLAEIAPALSPKQLILSIAAGIATSHISRNLSGDIPVIRIMPNTPALIQEGASALALGSHATETHLKRAQQLFNAVGTTVTVDESLMDAVTGLSGSGPAYLFLFIEALADAGVKAGLPRSVALPLAIQTCLGAAKMVSETGMHPAQLKDMVTSPGGTTIHGIHRLEAGGLRATLMDAVEAAANRSRELGAAKR